MGLLVSAVLVVAGCSNGGSASSDEISTASEARPIAERAALTVADVGSDWRANPDASQPSNGVDLRACGGGTKLTTEALATGKRNVFVQGTDVSHIAQVVQQAIVIRSRSVDEVTKEMEATQLGACLKKQFPTQSTAGQRFDIGHMTVRAIEVKESDHATLVSLPVTAIVQQSSTSSNGSPTAATTELPGTIAILAAQRGQLVSVLAVMSFGIHVTDEQIVNWASSVVARAS